MIFPSSKIIQNQLVLFWWIIDVSRDATDGIFPCKSNNQIYFSSSFIYSNNPNLLYKFTHLSGCQVKRLFPSVSASESWVEGDASEGGAINCSDCGPISQRHQVWGCDSSFVLVSVTFTARSHKKAAVPNWETDKKPLIPTDTTL